MNPESADPSVFDQHLADWRAWQQTPWGRMRYSVVWHVLERHLPALGPDARVLDFGGGDGTESIRLAGLGHRVTLVDQSQAMLDAAREAAQVRGVAGRLDTRLAGSEFVADHAPEYDLVLCHFVVQYLDDPAELVAGLAARLRPGGLLSLIAPNPASQVLALAVRELAPERALQLLGAPTITAQTFDHEVARITADTAEGWIEAAGLEAVGRYGGRTVIDLIADNDAKQRPDVFDALERLEHRVCDVSPYRDIGAYWHVVAARRG